MGRPHLPGRLQILLYPYSLWPWLQNLWVLLPCAWLSVQPLFPVFAFLPCKPGLHLCPGAWSYIWLFWNVHWLSTANPVEPPRVLCISNLSLFHLSVFRSTANSVCNGVTFFSSHWSNYKIAQAVVGVHLTGKCSQGITFLTYYAEYIFYVMHWRAIDT